MIQYPDREARPRPRVGRSRTGHRRVCCPNDTNPLTSYENRIIIPPGGVCPFGVNDGVAIYLDESLRKFDTVYPAAGNGHTAVKLTLAELEAAAGAEGWVDVCKEPET